MCEDAKLIPHRHYLDRGSVSEQQASSLVVVVVIVVSVLVLTTVIVLRSTVRCVELVEVPERR